MILQDYQIADLERLRVVGSERLYAFDELLSKTTRTPPDYSELSRMAAEALADHADFAPRLVNILMFLVDQSRRPSKTIEQVLDDLDAGLRRDAGWDEAQFTSWQGLRPALAALLGQAGISYAIKAMELSYDYANLLGESRIITDVRPVFDEGATSIRGAVISFTLRLEYTCGNVRHGLSLALDKVDLNRLRSECERAALKAQTAGQFLNAGSRIPTTIIGGNDGDR